MHRRLAVLAPLLCTIGCEDVTSLLGLEPDPYDADPLAYQDLLSVEDCPARRTEGDKPLSVYRRPPKYPEDALRDGLEGRVLIEADFVRDGTLSNPRVVAFEPTDAFNSVALEAVAEWRYCPIADGDPPYPSPFRIAIPFSISSGRESAAEANPMAGGTGGRPTY